MRRFLVLLFILLPGFAASDPDALDIDEYRGKVVLLDFWASWCGPCKRSFPWMNEMQDKYAESGLVIVSVNVDKERANAQEFLAERPARFTVIYDPEASIAKAYEVEGMPTSFVIGREGVTLAEHIGFKVKHQADYEAAIVAALESGASE